MAPRLSLEEERDDRFAGEVAEPDVLYAQCHVDAFTCCRGGVDRGAPKDEAVAQVVLHVGVAILPVVFGVVAFEGDLLPSEDGGLVPFVVEVGGVGAETLLGEVGWGVDRFVTVVVGDELSAVGGVLRVGLEPLHHHLAGHLMSAFSHADSAQVAVGAQIAVVVHADAQEGVPFRRKGILERFRVDVEARVVASLVDAQPDRHDVGTAHTDLDLRRCALEQCLQRLRDVLVATHIAGVHFSPTAVHAQLHEGDDVRVAGVDFPQLLQVTEDDGLLRVAFGRAVEPRVVGEAHDGGFPTLAHGVQRRFECIQGILGEWSGDPEGGVARLLVDAQHRFVGEFRDVHPEVGDVAPCACWLIPFRLQV